MVNVLTLFFSENNELGYLGPARQVLRAADAFCALPNRSPCCCSTGYQFIYYSPENTAKAKEVLSYISQLQPLIATHADLLLSSASQRSPDSLKTSLKMLSEKVRSKSLSQWGKRNPPVPEVLPPEYITFHDI